MNRAKTNTTEATAKREMGNSDDEASYKKKRRAVPIVISLYLSVLLSAVK